MMVSETADKNELRLPVVGARNLFTYWDGPDYSLIRILRKLMRAHSDHGRNFDLHVVNRASLETYIGELPAGFDEVRYHYQADYIRVELVRRYGGIWVDADTLLLTDLKSLFATLERSKGFFIIENDISVCNGVFGSIPQTDLMRIWSDHARKVFEAKGGGMEWGEIGFLFLTPRSKEGGLDGYEIMRGLDTVFPMPWQQAVDEYLLKPYDAYPGLARPFQPLLILIGTVYRHVEALSEAEIWNMDAPLRRFLEVSVRNAIRSHFPD